MRADIQGLRAVAVLLVVLYHAGWRWVPGGFVGVDVFFVISGFLITGMLVKEAETHGRIYLLNFFARRARRLLPAGLTLIVAVTVAAQLLYPPLERTGIVTAGWAAALYSANLWFTVKAVDYLGGDAAINPLLHMWSLGVEEQFYLLWPLLVLLAATRLRAKTVTRRVQWMTILVIALTFLACVWMTRRSQPWAFFLMPFRAWEFGLGALPWHARGWLQTLPNGWLRLLAWAGVAAIAVAVVAHSHDHLFPGPWALLPAGGTAAMLAGLHVSGHDALRSLLSLRPMVRVGDVSYSWYLWHWPMLVMAPVLWPQGGLTATVLAVVLSYLLAEASYRWVEQPFRVGRIARIQPRPMVLSAAAASLVTAGTLSIAYLVALQTPVTVEQQRFIDARADTPSAMFPGCHGRIRDRTPKPCAAGNKTATRTIVLLGDSHAQHWLPALDKAGREHDWRIVSFTKSACPWVDTPVYVELVGFLRPYDECSDWRAAALPMIVALKPEIILMGAGSRYARVTPAMWEEGAKRTLGVLANEGVTSLRVMHDTPWPEFSVPTCLARAEHR